jgi:hypothetical protein
MAVENYFFLSVSCGLWLLRSVTPGLHLLQVLLPWGQIKLGVHATQSLLRTDLPLLRVSSSHIFAPCSTQLLLSTGFPDFIPTRWEKKELRKKVVL